MSLCEPIRREIEEQEAMIYDHEYMSEVEFGEVMEYALGGRRPPWLGRDGGFYEEEEEPLFYESDIAKLVVLWRRLRDCELEAMKELKT